MHKQDDHQSFEDLLASQSSLLLATITVQFEQVLARIALEALHWFDLDRASLIPNSSNAYKEEKILTFAKPGVKDIYDGRKTLDFAPYLAFINSRKLSVEFSQSALAKSSLEAIQAIHQQGVKWHCILPLTLFGNRWGAITASRFSEHNAPMQPHQLVRLKLLGELWASYWQFAILTRNLEPQTQQTMVKEDDLLSLLSLRQREVMSLLASGNSAKEVANKLFLSPRTVESHKYRIMDILGLTSHSQLVQFAASNGLIAG